MGLIVNKTASASTMGLATVLLEVAAALLGTMAATVNMVCQLLQILI